MIYHAHGPPHDQNPCSCLKSVHCVADVGQPNKSYAEEIKKRCRTGIDSRGNSRYLAISNWHRTRQLLLIVNCQSSPCVTIRLKFSTEVVKTANLKLYYS